MRTLLTCRNSPHTWRKQTFDLLSVKVKLKSVSIVQFELNKDLKSCDSTTITRFLPTQ